MKNIDQGTSEEEEGIKLVISKKQAMFLALGLTLLPTDISTEDILSLNNGNERGKGVMLAMLIKLMASSDNTEEREKLKQALSKRHSYINKTVTISDTSDTCVSKEIFKQLFDIAMLSHGKMYNYGISGEEVFEKDKNIFNTLRLAHKLLKE